MMLEYLPMTITGLMIVIAIVAFTQNDPARKWASWIVATVTVGFDWAYGNAPAPQYFIYAALADLLLIVVLSSIANPTKIVFRLMTINALFIIVNAVGWAMWYIYQPDTLYVTMSIILYIMTLITMCIPTQPGELLSGQGKNGTRYDSVFTRLFGYIRARSLSNRKGEV